MALGHNLTRVQAKGNFKYFRGEEWRRYGMGVSGGAGARCP